MPWQTTQPNPPASVTTLAGMVNASVSTLQEEAKGTATRLNTAPNPTFTQSPSFARSAGSGDALTALADLLGAPYHFLVAHPWQEGVGQSVVHKHQSARDYLRYLSAANAVEAIANKWRDINDTQLPQHTVEAVVIVLAATNLRELSDVLTRFCAVFPLPELIALQQRCAQLNTLSSDKKELPEPAINTPWQTRNALQFGAASASYNTLTQGLTLAHAAEQELNPVDELTQLAAKKGAAIEQYQQAVSALTNTAASGQGQALFLNADSPSNLANTLHASLSEPQAPAHNKALSVGVLIAAPAGGLTFVKQALGL